MSRKARRTVPGVVYEVVSRLQPERSLTPDERARFLSLLGRALDRTDWRRVAYRLESDRLCFIMIAGTSPLDSWARRVHGAFARWLNRRRATRGGLFRDRPSVRAIADDSGNLAEPYEGLLPSDGASSYLEWSAEPACGAEDALQVRRLVASIQEPMDVGSRTSALLFAAAELCGISPEAFERRYARGLVSKAKRIAIHAAVDAGIPVARVAAALDITRQRGSAIAHGVLDAADAALVRRVLDFVRERHACELRLRLQEGREPTAITGTHAASSF